jgi:hypothetical protein
VSYAALRYWRTNNVIRARQPPKQNTLM